MTDNTNLNTPTPEDVAVEDIQPATEPQQDEFGPDEVNSRFHILEENEADYERDLELLKEDLVDLKKWKESTGEDAGVFESALENWDDDLDAIKADGDTDPAGNPYLD